MIISKVQAHVNEIYINVKYNEIPAIYTIKDKGLLLYYKQRVATKSWRLTLFLMEVSDLPYTSWYSFVSNNKGAYKREG